jgi:hypothetical protein
VKLADDPRCKRWLFHPAQRTAERAFFAALRLAARKTRREHHEHQQFLKGALRAAQASPPTTARLRRDLWREFEQFGVEFERRHGRWPSLEDDQAFWAKLNRHRR